MDIEKVFREFAFPSTVARLLSLSVCKESDCREADGVDCAGLEVREKRRGQSEKKNYGSSFRVCTRGLSTGQERGVRTEASREKISDNV